MLFPVRRLLAFFVWPGQTVFSLIVSWTRSGWHGPGISPNQQLEAINILEKDNLILEKQKEFFSSDVGR